MPHKPKIKLGDLPEQVQKALEFAVDRKAVGPVIMQVSELAGYTDWVVIVSATSQRHAQGISDAIVRGLRGIGCRPLGTDGLAEHTWALLDYDDFIVHVFYHPVRDYYDLESMWSDAPRVELGLPDAVMDTSGLGGLFSPEPTSAPTNDDQFAGYDDEFDDDDFDENYEDEAEFDDDDDGEYDDLLGEDEADKTVEREDIASG
ncbi:MAG: ribosome silencing factor [Nannocystaceae bacterium]